MEENQSKFKPIFRSDLFRATACCLGMVASLMILADFEGVTTWLMKKYFGGESFVKYKVEAVTQDGKVICLAIVKQPEKDDKIKEAKIRVRKIEGEEEVVKIDVRKGISWLFK